jgi:hypothetical protein
VRPRAGDYRGEEMYDKVKNARARIGRVEDVLGCDATAGASCYGAACIAEKRQRIIIRCRLS